MKHGTNCDCGMCKMGKAVGMIKKPDQKRNNTCSCGSGKSYEECHGKGK
ncbi:SEC-C domain-containing protein [Patescibacteria group bacterium]|nr:SEC-C domain-containing protein [Patescibacteria group bacterium]